MVNCPHKNNQKNLKKIPEKLSIQGYFPETKSLPKLYCGCTDENEKNVDFNKLRLKATTGLVNYVPQEELNKLNPYLASVAGRSYLNLSKFGSLRVYFPDNNTPEIDKVLAAFFPGTTKKLVPWNKNVKDGMMAAISQIVTFINTGAEVVNDYNSANIVLLNLTDVPYLAAATSPFQLDVIPDILNGRSYQFWNNAFLDPNNVAPGSILQSTALHEFGHTFGLAHPHDTGNNTKIIPGAGFNSFYNQGFFCANNAFSTMMSYIDFGNSSYKPYTAFYKTMMPIDLASMRFLYKPTSFNPLYVEKFLDLTCSRGVMQTLVSGGKPIPIVLDPSADLLYYNDNFNLSLTKFNINCMETYISPFRQVSCSNTSYNYTNPDPAEQNYFGGTMIDSDCIIDTILNYYIKLNIFVTDIDFDTTIATTQLTGIDPYSQEVNVYLKCSELDYDVVITNFFTSITGKKTKKKMLFVSDNFFYKININYGK